MGFDLGSGGGIVEEEDELAGAELLGTEVMVGVELNEVWV